MTPFYTRFPDVAARETRCIHILQPGQPLPVGEYGFMELYCDEEGCDCRRVLLQVTTPKDPLTPLATINYGWESVAFYTRWMHGDAQAGREITSASLDPLNPQSEYAEVLLGVFRDIVKNDPAYVARLARHYRMFKGAPGHQPHQQPAVTPLAATPAGGAASKASNTGARKDAPDTRAEFRLLNDLMQQGYDLLEAKQTAAACDAWLRAWDKFRHLYEQGGFKSLRAFDQRFRGLQCVYNWVQDLEMELYNAGFENPVYFEHRVRFCEEFLRQHLAADSLMFDNMRRALADSWASLGQRARSDALFDEWLREDPRWGWGWIGWADTFYFGKKPDRDLARAEALLKRGLEIEGVRDSPDLLDRLASVYEEQGRTAEANAVRLSLKTLEPTLTPPTASSAPSQAAENREEVGDDWDVADELLTGLPPLTPSQPSLLQRGKPGRNDPCPCGSGKKYKKCCGRN